MRSIATNLVNDSVAYRADGSSTLFAWAVVTIGLAFFCTEHNLFTSRMEVYGTTADELEAAAGGDHLMNQFGFSLVAVLGLCLLASHRGLQFKGFDLLGILVIAALAWCIVSRLWTINPWLTTKRLGVLLFCFVGALGVAKQLSAWHLCLLTLILTTCYAALGVCAELALGTFQPWSSAYRFAGTLHPNGQGDNCACICLAAVPLFMTIKRGKLLLTAIVLGAVTLLLLTKSRTACFSLLAALSLFFLLKTSLRFKVLSAIALGCAACTLLIIVSLFGGGSQIASAALLGREQDVGTLTGRTELWEELLPYAQARPLLGYGYGSFWTPEHIAEVSSTVYWGTQSAHSIYLEAVLATGLVGMLIAVLGALVALSKGGMLFRTTGDPGQGFLFALLAYGLINGASESGFTAPSLTPWIMGAGLVQLAFFTTAAAETKHDAA